jgi:hypothetical protein
MVCSVATTYGGAMRIDCKCYETIDKLAKRIRVLELGGGRVVCEHLYSEGGACDGYLNKGICDCPRKDEVLDPCPTCGYTRGKKK